ncbi:unnamed protein product [Cyprideis torosa]|uniref:Uncharacterized protein n=1 Tax=Cyprideis torosa TaxID=163714 RepID=A0A7R8WHB3_9CRUS|nr:unnamed protein product [Cyprideis torosa]CAG0893078.1 unnamed protein product [Cyprideis torosa]
MATLPVEHRAFGYPGRKLFLQFRSIEAAVSFHSHVDFMTKKIVGIRTLPFLSPQLPWASVTLAVSIQCMVLSVTQSSSLFGNLGDEPTAKDESPEPSNRWGIFSQFMRAIQHRQQQLLGRGTRESVDVDLKSKKLPDLNQLKEQAKQKISELVVRTEDEIDSLRLGNQLKINQLTKENEEKVQALRNKARHRVSVLEAETEDKVQKLTKDIEGRIRNMTRSVDESIKIMTRSTQDALDNIRGVYQQDPSSSAEMEVVLRQLTSELNEKIKEMEKQKLDMKLTLQSELDLEVEKLRLVSDAESAKLTRAAEKEIKELSKDVKAQIRDLTTDAEQKIRELSHKNKQAINRLSEDSSRQLQELQQDDQLTSTSTKAPSRRF